jgi:hypothetical protein
MSWRPGGGMLARIWNTARQVASKRESGRTSARISNFDVGRWHSSEPAGPIEGVELPTYPNVKEQEEGVQDGHKMKRFRDTRPHIVRIRVLRLKPAVLLFLLAADYSLIDSYRERSMWLAYRITNRSCFCRMGRTSSVLRTFNRTWRLVSRRPTYQPNFIARWGLSGVEK